MHRHVDINARILAIVTKMFQTLSPEVCRCFAFLLLIVGFGCCLCFCFCFDIFLNLSFVNFPSCKGFLTRKLNSPRPRLKMPLRLAGLSFSLCPSSFSFFFSYPALWITEIRKGQRAPGDPEWPSACDAPPCSPRLPRKSSQCRLSGADPNSSGCPLSPQPASPANQETLQGRAASQGRKIKP